MLGKIKKGKKEVEEKCCQGKMKYDVWMQRKRYTLAVEKGQSGCVRRDRKENFLVYPSLAANTGTDLRIGQHLSTVKLDNFTLCRIVQLNS